MDGRDPASFRDPSGHIHHYNGRILRTVAHRAVPGYERVRDTGLLRTWIDAGKVVETREVPVSELPLAPPVPSEVEGPAYLLDHARIPFISWPYEWPFAALKAAALLHLDLQIEALARDVQLSDATAYNVQFDGARPVFIDVLSFVPYREGDYWMGHRQFCEQFLNPLLLRALCGVPHNAWLRGSPEGVTAAELNAVLPAGRKVSWNVFSQVTLPARVAAPAAALKDRRTPIEDSVRRSFRTAALKRTAYHGLLAQLRGWIAGLEPRGHTQTTWSDYETSHTYADAEHRAKHDAVTAFVGARRPGILWDLGCNTGEYSQLALESGAQRVVGFEADHGALERAFARAAGRKLAFLPLFMDAANPSPDQGWAQRERAGLQSRGPADALLALAFIHHLAIGRNVPLDQIAAWLTSSARSGIVEFVQKSDPTVQLMLSTREDIFDTYTEEAFAAALGRHARIVERRVVSAAGRTLFFFDTAQGSP